MIITTLSKTFTLIHIRLYKRKIAGIEARSFVVVLLIIFDLIFLINIFTKITLGDIYEQLIYLTIITTITFFWITTWLKADRMLKHARDAEILHQKYLAKSK